MLLYLSVNSGSLTSCPPLTATFVGANADAGPVGASHRVWLGIAIFDQGTDEFVHEVRVRTTVTATLDERQMVCILNRLGEFANRFRQQMRVVGHFYFTGNFVLRLTSPCEERAVCLLPATTRSFSSCRRRQSSLGIVERCRTGTARCEPRHRCP